MTTGKIVITAVLIVAVCLTVAIYACIIAASEADRREEEAAKEWRRDQ